jgi:hypothetical protein
MAQLLELQEMPEAARHEHHSGSVEISTLSLLLCG